MDAATPRSPAHIDLNTLATELRALRNLLVTLSLQLTDIQFESDLTLRAQAILQTDQLLKACRSAPNAQRDRH